MTHARGLAMLGALVALLTVLLAAGMGLRSLGPDAPAAGARSTRIVVLNPGREATRVQVTYAGYAGACAGQVLDHKRGPRDLKPGELTVFDLSDMMESGLPDDCRAAATIRSEQGPVAAVALDGADKDETAAAYLPLGEAAGSRRIGVPRWQKREGGSQWVTRVHVMNLADKPARAQIELLDASGKPIGGCDADCALTLGPGAGATWDAGAIDALPEGKGGGSAVITSDAPLLAVVEDLALAGDADMMLALGITAGGGARPPLRYLPALTNAGGRSSFSAGMGPLSALAPAGAGSADGPAGIAGAGAGALTVQNLDLQGSATSVIDLFNQNGANPISLPRTDIPAGAAVDLPLNEETALQPGAYAAIVSADRGIGAVARLIWPISGGAGAYNSPEPATEVIVPVVFKQDQGRTSLISIQNTDTAARATAQLALFPSGQISDPIAATQLVIGPGTSSTIDIGKHPALASVPAPFAGWMRVTSQTAVVVQAFVDYESSARAVAAFEGLATAQLAATLLAPMVNARWAGDQPPPTATPSPTAIPADTATFTASPTRPSGGTDTPTASATSPGRQTETPTSTPSVYPTEVPSATDVPRATLTPLPGGSATATAAPTRRPPLVAGPGWYRPCGDAEAAVESRMSLVAVDAAGILWARDRIVPGDPRVMRCDPSARSAGVYTGLRDAVVKAQAEIRRGGTLSSFWEVDPRGSTWSDRGVFNGQTWTTVAKDDVHPEGGERFGRLALLDRDERGWMPLESEAECARPLGCRQTSARRFDEIGQSDRGITFESVPDAGAFGIPDLLFLSPPPAAPAAQGTTRAHGGSADAPAQGANQAWIVTPAGMYLPPDTRLVAYPFLGLPQPTPGASPRLRNAGYASTATVRPDGRLEVFTWVELQYSRGVEYKIYRNTWNGSGWAEPEDLSAGPLFRGAVRNERITAADYAPDGTLWVGTASGKLGSVKFGVWGHVFTAATIPLLGRPINSLAVGPDGTVFIALGEITRDDGTVLRAEVLAFKDEGGIVPIANYLPYAQKSPR